MKKIYIILIVSAFLVSCLEDIYTVRKEELFDFYESMKLELKKENIRWFEKNSSIKNIDRDMLFTIAHSLKNLTLENTKGEYSVTINYETCYGNSYNGSIIVRNTFYSPIYFFIRLTYEGSRWRIISIDKLPLEN